MDNSIVLNADGTELKSTESGFYVSPVRTTVNSAPNVYYDTLKNEFKVILPARRELKGTTPLSSNRRLSTDIQDVAASDSARVWDLRPVSYRALGETAAAHNADDATSYGFIAEEVAEVDPRLCFWGEDAEGMPQVEGVNYDQVIPLLLQEARQLKAETEALKAARAEDAARFAELQKKIEAVLLQLQ